MNNSDLETQEATASSTDSKLDAAGEALEEEVYNDGEEEAGRNDEKIDEESFGGRQIRKKKVYTICLTNCQHDSVKRSAQKMGLIEVEENEEWDIFWTDMPVTIDRVCAMKSYQKISHFPGMSDVCRKDGMARHLSRMQKLFPKEFDIAPKTWILPSDWDNLQAYARSKPNKTYILKPESKSKGEGIRCTMNVKDINPEEHQVCQLYLTRPFLIDDYKFDLRVYVLITSCDPLRIFVHREGLVRLATVKYCEPAEENVDNIYMHVTNYAIQKGSKDFVRNEERGTIRRLSTFNRWLEANGYDQAKIWLDIDDVIVKTLVSVHHVMKHNYRTCVPSHVLGSVCFDILGFDIILDRKMKPIVLEVNQDPSFTTDSHAVMMDVKDAVTTDSLRLINLGAVDKMKMKMLDGERDRLMQQNGKEPREKLLELEASKFAESQLRYEEQNAGNFRCIFPGPDTEERYGRYLTTTDSLRQ